MQDSEENNINEYKVSLIHSYNVHATSVNKCSICFLSFMAFIMLLIGLFTMISSLYIFITNVLDITYGSELFLMISGAAIILISIFLLISTCNYTNSFAKLILSIFSVFAFSIFAIGSSVTLYTAVYVNSNGLTNITEIDNFLNETMYYTYEICCNHTNSTEVLKQVCYDVMGQNETLISEECNTFSIFENNFLTYVHNILIWILSIGGITAVVNLISGITSCCLVTAYKRVLYYKPRDTTI